MFFPKDLNLSKKHVGGSKNVNIKKRPSHGETPLKIVEAGGIILKKKRSLLKLSDHSNEKLNKKNSKGHQIQSSHNKSFYLQNINNSQLSNPDIDSIENDYKSLSFDGNFENHVSDLKSGQPVINIPMMTFSPKTPKTSYWSILADSLLNPYTSQILVKDVVKKMKENDKIDKALKTSFTMGKIMNIPELLQFGEELLENRNIKTAYGGKRPRLRRFQARSSHRKGMLPSFRARSDSFISSCSSRRGSSLNKINPHNLSLFMPKENTKKFKIKQNEFPNKTKMEDTNNSKSSLLNHPKRQQKKLTNLIIPSISAIEEQQQAESIESPLLQKKRKEKQQKLKKCELKKSPSIFESKNTILHKLHSPEKPTTEFPNLNKCTSPPDSPESASNQTNTPNQNQNQSTNTNFLKPIYTQDQHTSSPQKPQNPPKATKTTKPNKNLIKEEFTTQVVKNGLHLQNSKTHAFIPGYEAHTTGGEYEYSNTYATAPQKQLQENSFHSPLKNNHSQSQGVRKVNVIHAKSYANFKGVDTQSGGDSYSPVLPASDAFVNEGLITNQDAPSTASPLFMRAKNRKKALKELNYRNNKSFKSSKAFLDTYLNSGYKTTSNHDFSLRNKNNELLINQILHKNKHTRTASTNSNLSNDIHTASKSSGAPSRIPSNLSTNLTTHGNTRLNFYPDLSTNSAKFSKNGARSKTKFGKDGCVRKLKSKKKTEEALNPGNKEESLNTGMKLMRINKKCGRNKYRSRFKLISRKIKLQPLFECINLYSESSYPQIYSHNKRDSHSNSHTQFKQSYSAASASAKKKKVRQFTQKQHDITHIASSSFYI